VRATIVLFDIDGTLVSCGGAGRRAMERAFADAGATASAGALEFDFGGMTDGSIARRGLARAGLASDDAAVARLLERYLVHLEDEVPRSPSYKVLPGVIAMLDRLVASIASAAGGRGGGARLAIGLGTGNVERGARVKLSRGALHDRFRFGGFGSDHEERAPLLRVGAERGAAELGLARQECRVVVIGDTPRDVEAALAIGAECLGVGTGRHTAEALIACGAHAAVADLEDERAWAFTMGATRR
jgi:phosphoglycolate phosphatase